ncbi:MAG: DNA-3-methyladenine glycosylase I [Planctomycetes bacterium]|nr:DNA-3-methyladenine glycosylase I [Planctomycetota bacterium]
MAAQKRCPWCGNDPLYETYHDSEWGVPSRDDPHLFEMLTLEGAQAGLSWITILKKRAAYRLAFAGFDPRKVARFTVAKRRRLMQDEGIVRNRLKIESAVSNAKAFLLLQREHGTFAAWLWSFVGGTPIRKIRRSMKVVPSSSELSDTISKELRRRGFRFVGTTIVYAYLQATGIINDHLQSCWRSNSKQ